MQIDFTSIELSPRGLSLLVTLLFTASGSIPHGYHIQDGLSKVHTIECSLDGHPDR